jgi:hemoglobin
MVVDTPERFQTHGIDQALIVRLVDSFYSRIRQDALIGPIFEAAIGDHWDEHLGKMYAFWASLMLGAGTYKGHPMRVHLMLPRLRPEHFRRWLALWRFTTDELCEPAVAHAFVHRAEHIAERFLAAIELQHA